MEEDQIERDLEAHNQSVLQDGLGVYDPIAECVHEGKEEMAAFAKTLLEIRDRVTSTHVGIHGRVRFEATDPGNVLKDPILASVTRASLAWSTQLLGKGLDMARLAKHHGVVTW